MMHLRDGIYFEQQPDGGVRIIVKESGMMDATMLREVTVDKHLWCSLIATMSHYGEEDYGFYRAANFHNGAPVPATMPLKDKLPRW